MKAYILSEDESRGIALANVINAANNTAIMGESESKDASDLIDEAADNVSEGYDLIVLISKAPVEACIAANKTSKLRAVVCGSQSDAMKAKKAKANMIIIDVADVNKTTASGIMRGWFSSGSAPAETEPEPKAQGSAIGNIGKGALGILNSGAGILKGSGTRKPKADKKDDEEEEEDADDMKKPKNGGIVANIKYMFGIE